jgi:hypothetical protein
VTRISCLIAAIGLVVGFTGPASAGEIKLAIRDGRVTLDARDVPVRDILTEWARVGRTKIVNAEKITGGPVTMQLTDVPERQALEILLRSVSGFMAAPRASIVADASVYDCILIMPTTRPATASIVAPPPSVAEPPSQRFRGLGMPVPRSMEDQEGMFTPDNPNPAAMQNFPGMTAQTPNMPGMNPNMPSAQQMMQQMVGPDGQPLTPATPEQANPSVPVAAPGVAVPGTVVTPPKPPGPGRSGGPGGPGLP